MNHNRNNSIARKIDRMSKEERAIYLATGRVTVDYVEQAVETLDGSRKIKRSYVAKIRGVIVGNSGGYTHETPEAAKVYGDRILAQWKADLLDAPQRDE